MCKYATYCPEDNVVHPCMDCIECLNSQEDVKIAEEIKEWDNFCKSVNYAESIESDHEITIPQYDDSCDDDLPF